MNGKSAIIFMLFVCPHALNLKPTFLKKIIFFSIAHNINKDFLNVLIYQQLSFLYTHPDSHSRPPRLFVTGPLENNTLKQHPIFDNTLQCNVPWKYRNVHGATMHLLIFDICPIVATFDAVMYMGADILFCKHASFWFPNLADNVLYAIEEGHADGGLSHQYWGGRLFSKWNQSNAILFNDFNPLKDGKPFNTGIMIFKPTIFMQSMFRAAFLTSLLSGDTDAFFDQGSIIFVLHAFGNAHIDNLKLRNVLSPCSKRISNDSKFAMIHFCGGVGSFAWKAKAMHAALTNFGVIKGASV